MVFSFRVYADTWTRKNNNQFKHHSGKYDYYYIKIGENYYHHYDINPKNYYNKTR